MFHPAGESAVVVAAVGKINNDLALSNRGRAVAGVVTGAGIPVPRDLGFLATVGHNRLLVFVLEALIPAEAVSLVLSSSDIISAGMRGTEY